MMSIIYTNNNNISFSIAEAISSTPTNKGVFYRMNFVVNKSSSTSSY